MKDKIFSICFVCLLCFIFLINIIIPDNKISKTERRKLEQVPNINVMDIYNKEFMEEFDSYVLDQFILRDYFRRIKAGVSYDVFRKLDNNKIYFYDGHIFKSEYPVDMKSIDNFISKVNSTMEILNLNNRVYYSIIPDKNYYVDDNKYLNVDYDIIYEKMKDIDNTYIELRDVLSLDDYYRTDTHWRQERLCKVVNRLGEYLDFYTDCNYDLKSYNDFYGVYYGQASLDVKPDVLAYLESDSILNSDVYYLDNDKYDDVYILDNLDGMDSYDVFLDGASSYIEITNELNDSGKELVIFRDSFSSSLAPLLIEFYSKITLIDMRYISSDNYLNYISFDDQDVLFLYSTLLVNDSYTLKG